VVHYSSDYLKAKARVAGLSPASTRAQQHVVGSACPCRQRRSCEAESYVDQNRRGDNAKRTVRGWGLGLYRLILLAAASNVRARSRQKLDFGAYSVSRTHEYPRLEVLV
jgi:hypothetical protein